MRVRFFLSRLHRCCSLNHSVRDLPVRNVTQLRAINVGCNVPLTSGLLHVGLSGRADTDPYQSRRSQLRLRKQFEASQKDTGTASGCGLLVGVTPKPGITRVVDFRPLPALDAASVEAATGSASKEVIGFYRTTPVCGVPMRDDDKALAAASFRHPTSVFLLVEAGKSGIGDARFCFWGEGELFDWPLMLFPFDAEELAVEEMRRRSSKPAPGSHAGLAPVASAVDAKAGSLSEVGMGATSAAVSGLPAAGTSP